MKVHAEADLADISCHHEPKQKSKTRAQAQEKEEAATARRHKWKVEKRDQRKQWTARSIVATERVLWPITTGSKNRRKRRKLPSTKTLHMMVTNLIPIHPTTPFLKTNS